VVLVGHDRGARVATRFAKDYPELVDRLVVMDNVPTRIVARDLNASIARAYWFFLFHLVPDLPEALIAGREHIWLRHFFSDWTYNPSTISGEAFDTYVRAYQAPGAVRGAMADYRANAEDVAQDMADAEVKITCPVMSLWGNDFHAVGKLFDMESVWAEMAENLRAQGIDECGHLPQEEQPEKVNASAGFPGGMEKLAGNKKPLMRGVLLFTAAVPPVRPVQPVPASPASAYQTCRRSLPAASCRR
jgi:pimeloyl-ACP methyl ester carboxylesterase